MGKGKKQLSIADMFGGGETKAESSHTPSEASVDGTEPESVAVEEHASSETVPAADPPPEDTSGELESFVKY